MKNKAIENMVLSQYDWDCRDVEVIFIGVVDGEYTFQVCHNHPYDTNPPVNLKVTIKVEEI